MNDTVFIAEGWSVGDRIERIVHDTLKGARFDALMCISTMNEEECREQCKDEYWKEECKDEYWKDSSSYNLTSKHIDNNLLEDNDIGTPNGCLIIVEKLEVFTGL